MATHGAANPDWPCWMRFCRLGPWLDAMKCRAPTSGNACSHALCRNRWRLPHIVAVLDPNMRVIECSDRIRWIIQKRTGGRWRSKYFCRTNARPITPALFVLPDRIS